MSLQGLVTHNQSQEQAYAEHAQSCEEVPGMPGPPDVDVLPAWAVHGYSSWHACLAVLQGFPSANESDIAASCSELMRKMEQN